METNKKKDDWVKLASKSRPGRFYLFNKSTGETEWLPLKDSSNDASTSGSKNESPPTPSVSKPKSKTPAQDRLKRLQHNLKANQIRAPSTRVTRHSSDTPLKSKNTSEEVKEQENLSKDQACARSPTKSKTKLNVHSPRKSSPAPATSPTKEKTKLNVRSSRKTSPSPTTPPTKEKTKQRLSSPRKSLSSPKRPHKRPHSSTELEKLSKSSSPPNTSKISRLSETLNISPSTSAKSQSSVDTEQAVCDSSKYLATKNDTLNSQNEDEAISSTLNNLRSGIVRKIKEICKFPFSPSKKSSDEKPAAKEKTSSLSSNLINSTTFKPAKNTKDTKRLSASLQEVISQLNADQQNSANSNQANTSLYSTPKSLNIPTYPRGSANSRLERLRQSLQLQPPSSSAPTSSSEFSLISEAANTSQQSTALKTILNDSNDSICQTADSTATDEVEAMDWQPIREPPTEISSGESISSNEFKVPSVKSVSSDNEKTMGDIYDTVNENLLRFSAEKQKESLNNNNYKWKKEFYYFITDTNVLLRDLCFIEDLSNMKLCDTKGSILYIPYCVLQELDMLKMRSGCQEGVKTLAVRAIKYLNKKFESKSSNLQAQSALEERNRLIKINCADDSIINSCLQIKEHVPNLLLLTEDVNLRNKAICNNILVSTKSDLMSKNYDANDEKEQS